MRHLIINADDFGLSDGVCAGILQAWRAGIVTSTSVLTNVDGAPDRVVAARATAPKLPLGLHLNLTTGRPVLPPERVPTLVDGNGMFHHFPSILPLLPRVSLSELRAELWAQAQLLQACGARFDHLDYHHHLVVLYPPFFALARELARAFRVPVRQPVPSRIPAARRNINRPVIAALLNGSMSMARQPRRTLSLLHRMLPAAYLHELRALRANGIATPDRFLAGFSAATTLHHMSELLRRLPAGVSELMVHPGLVDEQLRQLGGTAVESRETELALLLSPHFRAVIEESGVGLVNFGAVRA